MSDKKPASIREESEGFGRIVNGFLNELRVQVHQERDFGLVQAWVRAQEIAIALRDGKLKLVEVEEDGTNDD